MGDAKLACDNGALMAKRPHADGCCASARLRCQPLYVFQAVARRSCVIERQLAHQEQNAVRAAYDRAEYLNERRAMMKRWADHLDVIAGENIVPYKSNDGKLRSS